MLLQNVSNKHVLNNVFKCHNVNEGIFTHAIFTLITGSNSTNQPNYGIGIKNPCTHGENIQTLQKGPQSDWDPNWGPFWAWVPNTILSFATIYYPLGPTLQPATIWFSLEVPLKCFYSVYLEMISSRTVSSFHFYSVEPWLIVIEL